jgi:hypothetical protein
MVVAVRRHSNGVLAGAGEIFCFYTVMQHGTAVAARWCGTATVVAFFYAQKSFFRPVA